MERRPRIAAITTEYRKYSHAQHIVDRFLDGYGWDGRHHRPPMDLVALYVDQTPENDLSHERAGRWSWRLLEAALSRSDSPLGLTEMDGHPQDLLGSGELKRLVEQPAAYVLEYRDGTCATLLMLNGAVRDFLFAAQLAGETEPRSTQFLLTPGPNVTYSACLVAKIEETLMAGVAPYPVERTMLVSGMLEACLTSRAEHSVHLATPHLAVCYQAPEESQYART